MTRAEISRRGGRARAARLSPARRSQIARLGWLAMVARRFAGDAAAAKRWLTMKGLAAQDPAPWNGAWPDPGPMPPAPADLPDPRRTRGTPR